MISSSAKQGRSSPPSVSVGSNSAAFRRAKSANSRPANPLLISTTKKSFFTLPFPLCTTHSLPSLHPPSLTHSPRKTQLRREETEWANKSKQNYLKTHTTDFLSYFPPFFLPSDDRKKTSSLSVSFDVDSSIVRSFALPTCLFTSSTRNQAVLSPPTSLLGCLGTKTNLSVLFCALNAHFPLGTLGGLLEIYSFFSALTPPLPKIVKH
jgi:hypothetical protein